MKLGFIVVLCFAFAFSEEPLMTKEDAIKKFFIYARLCIAETGATNEVLTDFIGNKPAKSTAGKCFTACLMKKGSTLSSDGKLIKSGLMNLGGIYANGDNQKIKIIEEIIDTCLIIKADDDHCEAASMYANCLRKEAKNRNIMFVY